MKVNIPHSSGLTISGNIKVSEKEITPSTVVEAAIEAKEEVVARIESPELPWVFQDFPSHFVPYGGKRFFIKPLDWSSLSRLHAIRMKNNKNSFSQMLDVFNSCIKGIDIRDLTPGDFYSFMYWTRINSYPKTPLTLNFDSRYGGDTRKIMVRMSKGERDSKLRRIEKAGQTTNDKNFHELEIMELTMTEAEFAEWKAKGIRFPTVRDMELLSTQPIPDELQYISKFAQYIKIDEELNDDNYFQKHIDALTSMDLSFIEEIDTFAKLITHGVVEKIGIIINDLDEKVYLEKLIKQRDTFHSVLTVALDSEDADPTQVTLVTSSLASLNEEIERVELAITNNEKIVPDEEEVRVSINLNTFFPIL